MARRDGIFSRIARALGFGSQRPEPSSKAEPAPEPIMRQRTPQTVPSGPPRYHNGHWTGISNSEWNTIKGIADRNIDLGTTYNKDLDPMQLAGLLSALNLGTSPDEQRYKAIIDALESGVIEADEMIDLLRQADSAADDYAVGQSSARGEVLWQSVRDRGLPDELGYYHWEYAT